MVQQKKFAGDTPNGTSKREQPNMSFQRKDGAEARIAGGHGNRLDGKAQNGNRASFRTDSAISSTRPGSERVLQPWVPDLPSSEADGGLEGSKGSGTWDQFAENERRFGIKTDYKESIYTTTIDRSHPQYRERMAAAERMAREIERSAPATAHVAEERVMDFQAGDDKGGDEEDKYSGVRRQDFPPLGNRENKYTPPARRAPTGQATVKGAPVDPAIISAQLKGPSKQSTPQSSGSRSPQPTSNKGGVGSKTPEPKASKSDAKLSADSKTSSSKSVEPKHGDRTAATPLRPSGATSRTISPQAKDGATPSAPSATATVERDVLNSFKSFASQQRMNAEKVRSSKAKADKEVKLIELKKFADSFKLSTPVPKDLISIIAKDPDKQKKIQAKALQNAEEVAKAKADAVAKEKEAVVTKDSQAKSSTDPSTMPASGTSTESRSNSRPTGPHHGTSPAGLPHRQTGGRPPYAQQPYHQQAFRHDRSAAQASPHNRPTGNLSQRLRNVQQERLSQIPSAQQMNVDMRMPPTGPANNVDPSFPRRLSGLPPAHMVPKLNPNSHEFRPSPHAASFNPSGISAGSSPRSSAMNGVDAQSTPTPVAGQLIRRKTKAIDVKKCYILGHVQSIRPPQGRNWDENGGLRPSYDTIPTWRQLQEQEKPDSTMLMTYKEYFERLPFTGAALATPNPPHVLPQMPHQHQLPFHLQHGAHGMGGPRQSPHMPPMPMHGQPGHFPHVSFNNSDDHRMMHSNSTQSYASPRMGQVPMAYPAMGSPAQMPYNQQVVGPPFMTPGTPQMNQYRSFSSNGQFVPQQSGPMAVPMMPQQFVAGPNGMVPGTPQMPLYPGTHPQFMTQGGGPPQQMAGSNGYPSPSRSAAPMMVQQSSQQGQPMYGMSPGIQYQQPAFTPQHPGPMQNMRQYSNSGPQQQFGTSPQQMHQYGPQYRSGSNTYGNKNFQGHQHQAMHQAPSIPTGPQGRSDGTEEAK